MRSAIACRAPPGRVTLSRSGSRRRPSSWRSNQTMTRPRLRSSRFPARSSANSPRCETLIRSPSKRRRRMCSIWKPTANAWDRRSIPTSRSTVSRSMLKGSRKSSESPLPMTSQRTHCPTCTMFGRMTRFRGWKSPPMASTALPSVTGLASRVAQRPTSIA